MAPRFKTLSFTQLVFSFAIMLEIKLNLRAWNILETFQYKKNCNRFQDYMYIHLRVENPFKHDNEKNLLKRKLSENRKCFKLKRNKKVKEKKRLRFRGEKPFGKIAENSEMVMRLF
jgi:hypothetical protein